MVKSTKYHSLRNAKRFRVLVDSGAAPAGAERFWVCEGLAKPRRGAHWRFVSHAASTAEANDVRLDKVLGRAIIPTDSTEVVFVNDKGAVL